MDGCDARKGSYALSNLSSSRLEYTVPISTYILIAKCFLLERYAFLRSLTKLSVQRAEVFES